MHFGINDHMQFIESTLNHFKSQFYQLKYICTVNYMVQICKNAQAWGHKIAHYIIWAAAWDFQQCGMCDQQRLRSACTYTQPDQNLCWSLEYSMSVKLLIKNHLKFLSLKGCCTGLSESTLVRMQHCHSSYCLTFSHYSISTISSRVVNLGTTTKLC